MKNSVILNFENKTLTNLAGYDYGTLVYEKQVKGKIDIAEKFEIVFPDQIRGVASSFVQGFFADIVKRIGLRATQENAIIISHNEGFADRFKSKL